MGILLQVSLTLAVLILSQQRFEHVSAKPTVVREPVPTTPLSKDYQELLLILGKNLPGTEKEKAKVVDLMLQLLAEIDLPTLCQVIANDTTRKSKAFQDAFTTSGNINTDWLKERTLQKTASPLESETSLPSRTNDDVVMPTQDTTAFASLITEDSQHHTKEDENLADASDKPFSIYKGYYSNDRKQKEHKRPKIYKYHSIPSINEASDIDDTTYTQTDDVSTTDDYTTNAMETEATHPDVTKFLNTPYTSYYLGNGLTKSINTDGTLPYPMHKKRRLESLYNLKLNPVYSKKDLKAMRLRSMYNRLPENIGNAIVPTKFDESENKNIRVKSVEVERPKAQLYSRSLVLGDWFHGKSDFKTNWKSNSENLAAGFQENADNKDQSKDNVQSLRATIPSNFMNVNTEEIMTEESTPQTPRNMDTTTYQPVSKDVSEQVESLEPEDDIIETTPTTKQQQHRSKNPQRASALSGNGMFKMAKSSGDQNMGKRLYQAKLDRFGADGLKLIGNGGFKYRDFVKNKQLKDTPSSLEYDADYQTEVSTENAETSSVSDQKNIISNDNDEKTKKVDSEEGVSSMQTTTNFPQTSTTGEVQFHSTEIPKQTISVEENHAELVNNETMSEEYIKGNETAGNDLVPSQTTDSVTREMTETTTSIETVGTDHTEPENYTVTSSVPQTTSTVSMVESDETEPTIRTTVTSHQQYQHLVNDSNDSEETIGHILTRSNSSDDYQTTESLNQESTNTSDHRTSTLRNQEAATSTSTQEYSVNNSDEFQAQGESSQGTTGQTLNKFKQETKSVYSNIPVNTVKVVPMRGDLPGKYHRLEELKAEKSKNTVEENVENINITSGIENMSKPEDMGSDLYSLANDLNDDNYVESTEAHDPSQTVAIKDMTTEYGALESVEASTYPMPTASDEVTHSSNTRQMTENSTQVSHDTTLSLESSMSTSRTPVSSYESETTVYTQNIGKQTNGKEAESDDIEPNFTTDEKLSELERFNKEHFPYQPTLLESFQAMESHQKPRIVTYIKNLDKIPKADNVVDDVEVFQTKEDTTFGSDDDWMNIEQASVLEDDKTTLSVPHFIQPVYIDYGDEMNDVSEVTETPFSAETMPPTQVPAQEEKKAVTLFPTGGSETNSTIKSAHGETPKETASYPTLVNVEQRNITSTHGNVSSEVVSEDKEESLNDTVSVISEGKLLNSLNSTLESDSLVRVEQNNTVPNGNLRNISNKISTAKANLADAKMNVLKRLGRKMGGKSEYEAKLKQALNDNKNSFGENPHLKNSKAKYSGMEMARSEKNRVAVAYLDKAPIVDSADENNEMKTGEFVTASSMKKIVTENVTTTYIPRINTTDASSNNNNEINEELVSVTPRDKVLPSTTKSTSEETKRSDKAIPYHAFFETITTRPDAAVNNPIPPSTQSPNAYEEVTTGAEASATIQTPTLNPTDLSGQFITPSSDSVSDTSDNYGDYYYGVFDENDVSGFDDEVNPISEIDDPASQAVEPNNGAWNLGLGILPQDVPDSYPNKPSAKPYRPKFSHWLSQEGNSGYAPFKGFIQSDKFVPSKLPKIDTWKAYNIALSKEKLQRQDEEAMAAYHDVHLYPDYGMEDTTYDHDYYQERYPAVENYLWNARPWPEDLESGQFKSLEENNMAASKFGKLPQPKESTLNLFSKNYDGMKEKLTPVNSPANSNQWGNRFSQGYYGRVFDDRSSFGKTSSSLFSPYPSNDILGNNRLNPSAQDLKDYVPAHAQNNHREHENLLDFDTPGSHEVYDTSSDNDVVRDSYRLYDVNKDRNEPIRGHSKMDRSSYQMNKIGQHSGSAENMINNDLYRNVQTSIDDVLPIVGSGGNSFLSSAASSLGEGVPAPDDFACPDLFGYHRDSQDCGSFFMCSWGMPYRLKCPDGTLWSQKESVCDWAANVECPSSHDSDY